MKVRVGLTIVLAAVALAIAVIRPFGAHQLRLIGVYLLIVAVLGAGRYAAYRESQKKAEILKAVPRRPLGLSDD